MKKIKEIAKNQSNPDSFVTDAAKFGIGLETEVSSYGFCGLCDEWFFNMPQCPCGKYIENEKIADWRRELTEEVNSIYGKIIKLIDARDCTNSFYAVGVYRQKIHCLIGSLLDVAENIHYNRNKSEIDNTIDIVDNIIEKINKTTRDKDFEKIMKNLLTI